MRVPRCSISLWSDVIGETSLPLCVRQSGRILSARLQIILLLGTLTFPSIFEVISETVDIILGTSGGGFAWRTPEAQGSGLSGNLFSAAVCLPGSVERVAD